MKSPLWSVLYLLQANSVQAKINLDCGTGLKVSLTVRDHSGPPRGSDKKQNPLNLKYLFLILQLKTQGARS